MSSSLSAATHWKSFTHLSLLPPSVFPTHTFYIIKQCQTQPSSWHSRELKLCATRRLQVFMPCSHWTRAPPQYAPRGPRLHNYQQPKHGLQTAPTVLKLDVKHTVHHRRQGSASSFSRQACSLWVNLRESSLASISNTGRPNHLLQPQKVTPESDVLSAAMFALLVLKPCDAGWSLWTGLVCLLQLPTSLQINVL